MILSSAPGSIFLFGEHSVVYDKPGIVSAIGMKTYCEIEKTDNSIINCSSKDYGKFRQKIEDLNEVLEYRDRMDLIKDLISKFYRKFEIKEGVDLRIYSNIPKESGGMSSSTAVLCSVFEGLNKTFQKVDKRDYYNFLLPFQKKIHGGEASGVELFSSTFGGYNKVKIGPVEYESLGNVKLPILIVDTGIEAKTSETVPYVKKGWELDKNSYEEIFCQIEQLVSEGEKAIKNRDLVKLGKLMVENHNILSKDLGVSHPKLNKIVNTALKSGAYGAKLSGGGKGGIAIILFPKKKEFQIIKKLEKLNCKIYKTDIGVGNL